MDVVEQPPPEAASDAPPADGDPPAIKWDVRLEAPIAEGGGVEGEGSRADATTLTLPRLVGVDLPVLCSRSSRALGFLGGGEGVAAACRGEARKLQFHFRPEDELSVPLTSQPRQAASRLLVRVRVERQRGTGRRRVSGAEVVGSVPTVFRFAGLADFQYLTLHSFLPRSFEGETVSKTRVCVAFSWGWDGRGGGVAGRRPRPWGPDLCRSQHTHTCNSKNTAGDGAGGLHPAGSARRV